MLDILLRLWEVVALICALVCIVLSVLLYKVDDVKRAIYFLLWAVMLSVV